MTKADVTALAPEAAVPADTLPEDTLPETGSALRIGIGIATTGRPEIVRKTLDVISRQIRKPDRIAICPVKPEDVTGLEDASEISIVYGGRGLTKQRNVLLDALSDCDIITFFDDDYFPSTNYLVELEKIFLTFPQIVMATGQQIADGIHGPGYSPEEGEHFLATGTVKRQLQDKLIAYNGYGCNMSFRAAPARENGIRFDEKLPLYGWLEDLDFSRQLAAHGEIFRFPQITGVHLGTKRGRQSGRRLGYSQIANVVYLMRKGTCGAHIGLNTMVGNFIMNLLRSFRPEPHVDRIGRLRGNLEALKDLIFGRLDPRRIESM